MKILVVSQYFWPEEFRINDICKGLRDAGHEVEVLTGLPNYPSGKIYNGYSIFKKGPKEYEGIKIKRTIMVPRGKKSSIMLGLNYLSFMVFGTIKAIPMLFKKYDRVFVFQVSPITSAVPALLVAKVKKIPSYIYIQDLWPETLYSIVSINNEKIRRVLKKVCNKIYNGFDKLLIASKGYEDILEKEGIVKDKLIYFPQWAEDFYSNEEDIEKENSDFIVTFAGNIGKAQSVDTIIKAANLAKDNKNIKWQIIGDGSEFENIKKLVGEYSLQETVVLVGRKPASAMPKYYSLSDALIVTLKSEDILKVTLPAKVQSYMAAGKPILAAISGEGNKVIKESKGGLVTEAEDFKGLYNNTIALYNMNVNERNILGKCGKEYFCRNFTREKLLKKLQKILN
ncbi:glycosyltransferase family 4 protein [Clostridium gasigenes]|uniref:glycosyltransferase family 4 protein n=1 Tax=Clostridium gasigenes TaxID=94869 RepID=UPI001C0C656A|nr:glycosyltransferase family 4 protein [Clostridium gasigenes]MBU3108862.1 glycosyltransferase family 4 protein [Clostridium gasigenes]